MKRILIVTILALLLLTSCSGINVKGTSVNIYFETEEKSYDIHLDDETAEEIKSIFDGKEAYTDAPSCSFDDKCGFNIGAEIYAIAPDGCGIIKHCPTGKYFNLTEDETQYVHSILEDNGIVLPRI